MIKTDWRLINIKYHNPKTVGQSPQNSGAVPQKNRLPWLPKQLHHILTFCHYSFLQHFACHLFVRSYDNGYVGTTVRACYFHDDGARRYERSSADLHVLEWGVMLFSQQHVTMSWKCCWGPTTSRTNPLRDPLTGPWSWARSFLKHQQNVKTLI